MKRKIYQNLWATEETYFVPTAPTGNGKYISGYRLRKEEGKWKLEKSASFYAKDLNDQKHFPVVGEIDIENAIIQSVLSNIQNSVQKEVKQEKNVNQSRSEDRSQQDIER